MKLTTFAVDGHTFVVVPCSEYDRLIEPAGRVKLPPLPKGDKHGNVPAIEYAQAAIARSILRDRVRAGLSRDELAALAGVRIETLARIESGTHDTNVATIDKLDHALRQRLEGRNGRRP